MGPLLNLLGAFWESVRLPWDLLEPFGNLLGSFGSLLGTLQLPWDLLGPLEKPCRDRGAIMALFRMLCGAVAAALRPVGSVLRPLGMPSELPWTPSDAGGRVVGHSKFCNQNKQIRSSIRQKMKRWSPKVERQHFLFKLNNLRLFNDFARPGTGAGNIPSPDLENPRTP